MTNDNAFSLKNQRPVRSYVLRQGRMTPAQEKALQELWPIYGLDSQQEIDIPPQTILEIGFGMGQSLIAQAIQHPENFYIGIEVHKPGVGSLLRLAQKKDIKNLKVFCKDAIEVLEKNIPDHALEKIQIFFPDPWPKKRHHKRRLIQPEFLVLVSKKLKLQGILHIATDWENYAEHILEVVNQSGLFKKIDITHDRPLTKFETRGKKLGHQVWDFLFSRN